MGLNDHGHSNADDRIRNAERTPRSAPVANRDPGVPPRSRTLSGGLDPVEMGRRSGEARRAKKLQREQRAQDAALTFRERLGVALSRLEQDDLDQLVGKLAKAGNANALARLADQAFGRPSEQDDAGDAQRSGLSGMSRDQLASTLAELDALTVAREHPHPDRLTEIGEGNLEESEPQPAEGHSPSA